jgi:hypothetical protein
MEVIGKGRVIQRVNATADVGWGLCLIRHCDKRPHRLGLHTRRGAIFEIYRDIKVMPPSRLKTQGLSELFGIARIVLAGNNRPVHAPSGDQDVFRMKARHCLLLAVG